MMGGRKFKSFNEIDRELQILKLRKDIAAESLKGRALSARGALTPKIEVPKFARKLGYAVLGLLLRKGLKNWK